MNGEHCNFDHSSSNLERITTLNCCYHYKVPLMLFLFSKRVTALNRFGSKFKPWPRDHTLWVGSIYSFTFLFCTILFWDLGDVSWISFVHKVYGLKFGLMLCFAKGLSDVLFDAQPSFSVISNGAECILLSKKFYREHATSRMLTQLRRQVGFHY